MSAVSQHRQLLQLGSEVVLYKLDLTPIGIPDVYFFCKDYGISFDGQVYEQVQVEMTELERNISGEMVQPRLSIPNATKFASALVVQHRDAVGAELTRTTTYGKFLDGQPGADGTAIDAEDVFLLEQKVALNKRFAQWESFTACDMLRAWC